MLMDSTRLKFFECLARTGWKSPEKAMLSQTKTLYYAQHRFIVSVNGLPLVFAIVVEISCT
jgi:hypothetical protein